jgi:signal transduction histidine kinase
MASVLRESLSIPIAAWREPRRVWRWLVFVAAFALLDRASAFFMPSVVALTPWDLAGGLAFGFLMLEGPSAAFVVALADFADDFLAAGQHSSMPVLALAAVVTAASYGSASGWLRSRGVRRLDRQSDLLAVGLAAALASLTHVSADLALIGRWGLIRDSSWVMTLLSSWIGAFGGVLIVAPLFILPQPLQLLAGWRRGLEASLMALILALVMAFCFAGAPGDRFRYFYLLFLPQIWVAVRFGISGAVLGNLLVQFGLAVYFLAGIGPRESVFAFQIRFVALAATILFLGCAVTERRMVESALRQRQDELARVARLSLAGEMAAAIAHQLNQPLMAAMAFTRSAQRLLRQAGPPATEPATRALDDAVEQAERAANIIRSLRDFIGRSPPQRTPSPLEPLIREAAQLVEQDRLRQDARLILAIGPGLPPAMIDAVQAQQVLINLLRNALEALEGAPRPRQVVVAARHATEGGLEVEVRDSGAGVPAEIAARLFEPFLSTKGRGLGRGLAVSRALVEAQGGRLWLAENTPGRCAFRFSLPVAKTRPSRSGRGA